jgi:hypothetical protein
MQNQKNTKKAYTAGGLVFVGALIMGIGLGVYYGVTAVGTLVGLGVGFVLFGMIIALGK